MSDFWNDVVKKFGFREDIINIPGAPSATNKYIDHLEKRALAPYLLFSKGKMALDVGTGIGRWTSLIAEHASYVIGIDISREMIKNAKKRVNRSNVDLMVATAYAIPLRSDSVDISLSCTCIQHIVNSNQQQTSIHEITRVTKSRILLLELMSKSKLIRLTHYPTLVIPRVQYISTLEALNVESIADIGVDFLPFVKLIENFRNYLFKRLEIKATSYGGSLKQRALRNSYQILSVFALSFSLPFTKIVSNPSSNLTRHVLLVARKGPNRYHEIQKSDLAFYEKEGEKIRRYDSNSYWDSRYHRRRKKRIVELLDSYPRIKTFLDVGCGTGEYLTEAVEISDSSIGLDISSTCLRRIKKKKHRNANLLQADAQILPFRDKSIDCILCSETLEHLPRPEIAIQEIVRVARKNFIISTPDYGLLRATLARFSQQSLRKLDKSVGHVRVLTLSQLREETLKSKCKIKSERTLHITPPIIGESLHLPTRVSALLNVLEHLFDKLLPKLGNVTLFECEIITNEKARGISAT